MENIDVLPAVSIRKWNCGAVVITRLADGRELFRAWRHEPNWRAARDLMRKLGMTAEAERM